VSARDGIDKIGLLWTVPYMVAAVFTGCSHAPFYTGDGKFTDNGFWAYSGRFVIDLGPIDLSKPRTYEYALGGLPRAEFSVAIRVYEETELEVDTKPEYPAVVRIEMQNDRGETVISQEGPLNSWPRSSWLGHKKFSDLYRLGESREIALANGNTRGERIGVTASGGWGTYFSSDAGEKFKLKVEIVSSSMNKPARVNITGWSRE
jgi:hypothetical protein